MTTARRSVENERGSAMIVVVGLGFAFVIMAIGLAVTSSFALKVSSETRAGVQVQAAADAGIDNALKQMNSVVVGKESGFKCTLASSVATTFGTADVVTEIKYRKVGDAEGVYSCDPGTQFLDGSEIVGAQMISKSTMATNTGSGQDVTTKSVKQVVDLDTSEPLPPLFNYGFFSHGTINANSGFTVTGGGVFTNGDFKCSSGASVYGSVVAIGSGYLTNSNCQVDSIWTGGKFECSSGARILGYLYVASSVRTYISSGCSVGGDVWTAGDFEMQGSTIGGNLLSAEGSIKIVGSSPTVGGWAQAATTVTGGTVTSARVENSPTVPPAAPVAENMPSITWADLTGVSAGSPPVETFGAWIKKNAEDNNAPSWSASRSGTSCQADGASYALNGGLAGPAAATIIDGRTCDIVFRGPMTFTLNADVTIVAKSFHSENSVTIVPGVSGVEHKLRIIVPLAAGAPACSGVSTGTISFAANGFTAAPTIDVLLYTNGKIDFNNTMTLSGSVYGCETSAKNPVNITYKDVTPPGMTDDDDITYNFRPVMRFDVRS